MPDPSAATPDVQRIAPASPQIARCWSPVLAADRRARLLRRLRGAGLLARSAGEIGGDVVQAKATPSSDRAAINVSARSRNSSWTRSTPESTPAAAIGAATWCRPRRARGPRLRPTSAPRHRRVAAPQRPAPRVRPTRQPRHGLGTRAASRAPRAGPGQLEAVACVRRAGMGHLGGRSVAWYPHRSTPTRAWCFRRR